MKIKKILVPLACAFLLAGCGEKEESSESSIHEESSTSEVSSSSGETIESSSSNSLSPEMSGSGTSNDPYFIESTEQFVNFAKAYNALTTTPSKASYYKLGADIDLSGVSFSPIGTSSVPFVGYFDGNGYSVKNVSYQKYDKSISMYGLFGYIESSDIHDLSITIDYDLTVLGSKTYIYVGGLAAAAVNSSIYNVSVTGDIDIASGQNSSSQLIVGGVLGLGEASDNYYVELSHATSKVNITSDMSSAADTTNIAGGIAGALSTSSGNGIYSLSSSKYEGNISAEDVAGGILGISSYYTSVVDCVALGSSITVSADNGAYAGGILGQGYYEMAVLHNYASFNTISAETTSTSSYYKARAGRIVGYSFLDGYSSGSDLFGTVSFSNYASEATITAEVEGENGEAVPSGKAIKEAVGLSSFWGDELTVSNLEENSKVSVKLDSNYSDGSSQNETLSFDKGTWSYEAISKAISKEFTREHYSYTGLFYDEEGKKPYCFFAPFVTDATLYAGYGDLSKLIGTYDYVCGSESSSVTSSGTWYFDEEYFYWQNKYFETFKYKYTFDGNYIFIGEGDGSYEDEIFIYNEDGTITGWDINDDDYTYTATKSSKTFKVPDYSASSYLGTWYVSNNTIVTLKEDGNATAISSTSETIYYGGFNEDNDGNVEIYVPGRIHASMKYDSTNNVFCGIYGGTLYFAATSAIDKTYSTKDGSLAIYVVGEKSYANNAGTLTNFSGSLAEGGEVVVGSNTYTVSGTTLTLKEDKKETIPSDICGTYTDSNKNTMILNEDGTGSWNGTSFTFTYDSSKKKGTISAFGAFDSDSNSFTVNDDGTITISIDDEYGENTYSAKMSKQSEDKGSDSTSDSIVGTYTDSHKNTMILNDDGTGSWNGTSFTYTYDSTNKKGTISAFGAFDSDSNSFTVNDDGTITISIDDEYGENTYSARMTKQASSESVPGYVGSWLCKTSSFSVTLILNADGSGSYNGNSITYTVKNNVITFSCGDTDVTLTYNESAGTMSGSYEYDYEEYSFTSITKQA